MEDCFLQAVETRVVDAVDRAERWSNDSSGFAEQTVTATEILCAEIAGDPGLAGLVFVDLLAAGPAGIERQDRILAILAERLGGRSDPLASRFLATASLAAAWAIVRSEVVRGRTRRLAAVAPLASFIFLAPIVGAAEAGHAIDSTNGNGNGLTAVRCVERPELLNKQTAK